MINTFYLGQYYDGNHMLGGNFGWGLFMMLFWLVAIVVIIVLVTRSIAPRADDALNSAKKRYAQGEISKTEFEQLKKDIK